MTYHDVQTKSVREIISFKRTLECVVNVPALCRKNLILLMLNLLIYLLSSVYVSKIKNKENYKYFNILVDFDIRLG